MSLQSKCTNSVIQPHTYTGLMQAEMFSDASEKVNN